MRKATAYKSRGIRWNFTTVLEDLDFADDIALRSFKFNDLREKTDRLAEEAAIESARPLSLSVQEAGRRLWLVAKKRMTLKELL